MNRDPSANGYTYFEGKNWLGSERIRTDYAAKVVATYTSLPFGDGSSVNSGNSYAQQDTPAYAMLDMDSESSTDHATFRQYSPTLAEWLAPNGEELGSGSVDELGLPTLPGATLPGSFDMLGGGGFFGGPGGGAPNKGAAPQPPNRNQRIAQCIAQVQSEANRSHKIIDLAEGVGLENAVFGCIYTGPLIFECEAGVAGVALLTAGVTYGAELYQEHQDEAACTQQP